MNLLLILIFILTSFLTNSVVALKINFQSSVSVKESEQESAEQFCVSNSTSSSVPSCSVAFEDLAKGNFVGGSASRNDGLLPKWINLTLARQGQKFTQNYKTNLAFSHLFELISGSGLPDLSNVLAFTEKSNSPEKALMRYLATLTQVLLWYDNIVTEDVEDNVVLTSLANVRVRHIMAAQKAATQLAETGTLIKPGVCENETLDDALWADFEKDLEQSTVPSNLRTWSKSYNKSQQGQPIPISQLQQALTLFGFAGFPTIYPERLLIDAKDEDIFAFNHLWAVIGYALGIDDDYNIALQPDINHIRLYYQRIMDDYIFPGIFNLPKNICTKSLSDSLLKAIGKMVPVFSPRVLLLRLVRDILKIDAPNLTANLSPEDRMKEVALNTVHLPKVQNLVTRALMNQALEVYAAAIGTKYYGGNYTTEESKAENIFYSMED